MEHQLTFPPDTERIIHEWKEGSEKPSFWGVLFLLFMNLVGLPVFLLSIFGYHEILGIELGKPGLTTYLGILSCVFLNYYFFSHLYNKTIVEISPPTLSIRITPLPWPVRNRVPISDIKEFKVVEVARKFGRRVLSMEYSIHVLTRNGDSLPIFINLDSKETADDYLRRIEKAVEL